MVSDPRIGTTLGSYRIEAVIGRGGMGVVYLADQPHLGRKVALKVLAPEIAEEEEFRQRFLRESRTSGTLEHPNIIPVYDAGEIEGLLFIAMRFVRGKDLKVLIEERGTLDSQQTVAILKEVGRALDAAHQDGYIHRDVKPANVLLASRSGDSIDAVYLTDFGLTKRSDSRTHMTKTGFFLGTMDYAAPEQFQGTDYDSRIDIYALGGVAYECLTGQVPFPRDSDSAVMYAHIMDPVPKASSVRAELSPEVDRVIERAMAKSRHNRYTTCAALVEALDRALHSTPQQRAPETHVTRAPATVVAPPTPVETPPRVPEATPPASLERPATDPAQALPQAPVESPPPVPSPVEVPPSPAGAARRLGLWFVLPALVLALALAVGAWLLLRDGDEPGGSPNSREGGAEVVLDSVGTVAFQSDRDGDFEVFTMEADGSDLQKLTDDDAKDMGPSWSPDGSQIVFASTREGEQSDLFVMNADGSDEQNVTNAPASDIQAAWSPDGAKIAFTSDRDDDQEIFVMNPDGTQPTQLTFNEANDTDPSWSPDSQQLVFTSDSDGDDEIVVMNADGTGPRPITETGRGAEADDLDPAWSPNRDVIAFSSERNGDLDVFTMDITGGNVAQLTDDGAADRDPAWSSDGNAIVFDSDRDGDLELFVMSSDGSGQQRLTRNDFLEFRPSVAL